jgi:hypothetical protein
MVERAAFVRRMRGVAIWAGSVRRSAAVAAGLGLLFWNLASGPATAPSPKGRAMASNLQGHEPFTGNESQLTSCWRST